MYLSDRDIHRAVEAGDIVISDFDTGRLQPASYDILLGDRFKVLDAFSTPYIDPVKGVIPVYKEMIIPEGESFILHPGVSILGTSRDYFGSDRYLIQLSGKSSLARIGLIVHNTAGLINPGHFLHVTFELCNLNTVPIILRPDMPIAQITFSELSTPPDREYARTGRYGMGAKNWEGYVEERAKEEKSE